MTWVIAWRPYSPDGMFVSRIGNLAKGENAIIAKLGVDKAMRFRSKGEAQMLYDSVSELKGHEYLKQWIIINLEDHDVRTKE